MTSELLELTMAFRGLSDEDDGISNPGEDEDEDSEDEEGDEEGGFGEEAVGLDGDGRGDGVAGGEVGDVDADGVGEAIEAVGAEAEARARTGGDGGVRALQGDLEIGPGGADYP